MPPCAAVWPHCSRIFLLNSSVIPLMGIFLCEIRKFYASSEKQAESCMTQINCIANWAAALFFSVMPPQCQALRRSRAVAVWTKHTAAAAFFTRRGFHMLPCLEKILWSVWGFCPKSKAVSSYLWSCWTQGIPHIFLLESLQNLIWTPSATRLQITG